MKGLLFGVVITLVATMANAQANRPSVGMKPLDFSKYCYYADLEYSLGSIMLQNGIRMECVKEADGKHLVWQKAS